MTSIGNNTMTSIEGSLEKLNKMIDGCNSKFSHYDIAVIVYRIFKDMYRYIGNNQWEYFDIETKSWIKDVKTKRFKQDINSIVVDLFIKRSLYWYEQSKNYKDDKYSEMNAKFMYGKMINSSITIKNDKYISTVIKEAKGFFDIHNE